MATPMLTLRHIRAADLPFDVGADAFGHTGRSGGSGGGQDDGEFLAAIARRHIIAAGRRRR